MEIIKDLLILIGKNFQEYILQEMELKKTKMEIISKQSIATGIGSPIPV